MSLHSAARVDTAGQRLDVQELRRLLERERGIRLDQLQALGGAPDGAREADDLLMMQKYAVRQALTDIDAAFTRLDEGTYGTCQGCGRDIPVERLEILPYARCCVPCQQHAG
ncbi:MULTISPECIES: TraR/DksA family transcriptional regulator [Streptomyces]|uniref:Zinc finger DksA/TraR C4-type domain-containing protein n=1 Tax=Streptomyces viridosporus (strain ATCC 14672 / DSM 40746 / JCM 4963 / KCTC 9882 / NRRL B-12104 / FH 1290) TaxID=566461 RepID=D5ZX11_STRV1|nr:MULTISPECIES: TraR/DksA C4-type zinc finger protein [Streptomyces]EFE65121.1 conserved hypothetical protein [Streptomyces viridosporus ATCC 14672]PWJ02284.1 molecular chaperone DnaK [Streptomyces sp. NWU49]